MPATSDTQLVIKQTLDTDPEINFIDVAAIKARNLHAWTLMLQRTMFKEKQQSSCK